MLHLNFSEDVWQETERHCSDLFGDDWPIVRRARDALLQATGLMHLDLKPANIRLR
jgi:hypothetical protein